MNEHEYYIFNYERRRNRRKKIEVIIFKDSMNESIFKLLDFEMIIILIKII